MDLEEVVKRYLVEIPEMYFEKEVKKPWGYERHYNIPNEPRIKILSIEQGHRLSLQYHNEKDEAIGVRRGELLLVIGSPSETAYPNGNLKDLILRERQVFHVFPQTIHRYCSSNGRCELVEASIGEDEDITRLEDDYRRERTITP